MFRDKIREEAHAQRTLREQNQPIPESLRRYARLAGLGMLLVCLAGAVLIAALGYVFGQIYYVAILFCAVFAALGFLQLVTGRHWVTGR